MQLLRRIVHGLGGCIVLILCSGVANGQLSITVVRPNVQEMVSRIIAPSPNNYLTVEAGSENTLIEQFLGEDNLPSPPWHFAVFEGGVIPADTIPVPDPPIGTSPTYAGGIGIASGVVLCTGNTAGNDPVFGGPYKGIEGPNDGLPYANPPYSTGGAVNQGEINLTSFQLHPDTGVNGPPPQEINGHLEDADMVQQYDLYGILVEDPQGELQLPELFDSAILQFKIKVNRPGYLIFQFVFATDEYPAWPVDDWNDTAFILIGDQDGENYQNILELKRQGPMRRVPLSLSQVALCEDIWIKNQTTLEGTQHRHEGNASYFDHEFGGFTKELKREMWLTPGTYTVKIAISDTNDGKVDSALFIGENGVRFFSIADYNGNGEVDAADYTVWKDSFGMSVPPGSGADGNGNGVIDAADYTIWKDDFGLRYSDADFNRDGHVDNTDGEILFANLGIEECADRFEGDADDDGDVDGNDFLIWQQEFE